MNKSHSRVDEKVIIPSFCDYKRIVTDKYKILELKQICNHYKLKNLSGKKKHQLLDIIFNYLRESYYAIRIQRIAKGFI